MCHLGWTGGSFFSRFALVPILNYALSMAWFQSYCILCIEEFVFFGSQRVDRFLGLDGWVIFRSQLVGLFWVSMGGSFFCVFVFIFGSQRVGLFLGLDGWVSFWSSTGRGRICCARD